MASGASLSALLSRPRLRYNGGMPNVGFIDFHCHLDDPCFDTQRWELIDRCFASDFSLLVTVADAYDERSLAVTGEMLDYHGAIAAVAGAHPHGADTYTPEVERRLLRFLDGRRVLALGEVGLDFHYDFSHRDTQERVFRRQAAIAAERRLPLVIHSRQAEARVLRLLEEERFGPPFVFHCYTGDAVTAAEIVARGGSLSFSGIVTFRKADALRQVVAATPLENLLSETDSPYLAPEPERGKVNTPLAVRLVMEKMAEIKKIHTGELQERVALNVQRLRR